VYAQRTDHVALPWRYTFHAAPNNLQQQEVRPTRYTAMMFRTGPSDGVLAEVRHEDLTLRSPGTDERSEKSADTTTEILSAWRTRFSFHR
jgi:hypothetical protein